MKALQRFTGGRSLMLGSAGVGVLGLAATFVGLAFDAKRTLFAYLFGFAFWMGLAIASLIMLATFHASKARWPVVLRRVLEAMAATCGVFIVLFIPIAAGMDRLFIWVHPTPDLGEKMLDSIRHKQPYLNVPFFLIRAFCFLVLWAVVAHLLFRWSARQDDGGDLGYTVKQRRLGAGSLPLLGITLTFAAEDWLMSLEPSWYSTVYGVYYFSGAFVAALAVLTLIAYYARGPELPGSLLSVSHFHSLGKLLLAFTAFWAYIAFAQFMLIWIANIPEEVTWFISRTKSGWKWVAYLLALGQFVVPFFALLSRTVTRNPRALARVAWWIVLIHALDTWWLVMPALHPDGPHFYWANATALVGLGGIALAFALWRLRGHYAVPVRDPYLPHSLRYNP